jgi:ElaB/YqjD/DUF883 family membrane-anchored ribosome-binding protein
METEIPVSSPETASFRTDQKGASHAGNASRLRQELSDLKSDLDALMSHASTLTEAELRESRDRIMARFSSMRHAAKGIASQAGKQLNEGMDVTVNYVRERPLQSVAIATGIGLILGAMLRRS